MSNFNKALKMVETKRKLNKRCKPLSEKTLKILENICICDEILEQKEREESKNSRRQRNEIREKL